MSLAQESPVLILSTKLDISTDVVCKIFTERGVPFTRLNTEDFPYFLHLSVDPCAGGSQALAMDYRSLWFRRLRSVEPVQSKADPWSVSTHHFCVREASAFLTGACLNFSGRVMSAPDAIQRAEYKLHQLHIASRLGLTCPATVVTNDPETVRDAFSRFGGQMICKPLSSGHIQAPNEDFSHRSIYSSQVLLEHLDDLSDVQWAPSIYQELIGKRSDVRVTIVGGRVFSARIFAQGDPEARIDWRRYGGECPPMETFELPAKLTALLLEMMAQLNLSFGAIDFIENESGEFVFLEVNPNGQWMWIEDYLGLPISCAVADWLVK